MEPILKANWTRESLLSIRNECTKFKKREFYSVRDLETF